MTKQEIEKAIENGESVWAVKDKGKTVFEVKMNRFSAYIKNNAFYANTALPYQFAPHYVCNINELVKTKAEVEHYLHHANITRTEQLPFYTFSEIAKDEKNFKMGKTYTLIEDKTFVLDINKSYVSQIVLYTGKEKYSWNFNEENFYKAYDECVRLFKGEV